MLIVAQNPVPGKSPAFLHPRFFLDFRDDSLQNPIMEKTKIGCMKNMTLVLGVLAAIGMAGVLQADQGGAEVLAKLNLPPAAAKADVLESLAGGTVYNEAAFKVFKPLPGPARETLVRAGLAWIKSYVSTGEFKAAYAARREQEKPEPPAPRPSADDQTNKMKADMEKSIAEMKKNMGTMDAEMKKVMEASIQAMRAQMKQMEEDPQQKQLMRQMAEMAVAEDKKHHEEKLKEWERLYPADPRSLIKSRIREFLAVSAGVDFAAKLLPRGDKMVFARDDHEQKPAEWKLCFRAGKEATAAARAVAATWLAELDRN
jgi:hypothetical protein